MMDMEKLGAELLSGRQGGAIRDMANSPEQLKALLTQILSTNEGKVLAEKLSRFENGK